MEIINIKDKLSQFSDHLCSKIVDELNDYKVQVVKLKGEFHWNHHERKKNCSGLLMVILAAYLLP